MKIKDIFIYPIKSVGGIQLNKAKCTEMGLEHDRRMMLIDDKGRFISQREFPKLATIGAGMKEDGFVFFDKLNTSNSLSLAFDELTEDSRTVQVWDDTFRASPILGVSSQWFSDFIGSDVTLCKMTKESDRKKSFLKPPGETVVSMADGYPYLFLSMASLADLNTRLKEPIPMERFRANIVLEDTVAYEEETLDSILVGEIPMRMIKPCGRCIMITIDQMTGIKAAEPLKVLSSYKQSGKKIIFGMNAISLAEGLINIGDEVSIIK